MTRAIRTPKASISRISSGSIAYQFGELLAEAADGAELQEVGAAIQRDRGKLTRADRKRLRAAYASAVKRLAAKEAEA
jgi:hypothetical protein